MNRTRRPTPTEQRLVQLERALEYLARGWPPPSGEETPAQLIGMIFDMRNFASAILAGIEPVSARQVADSLAESGAMTRAARAEIAKIFGWRK